MADVIVRKRRLFLLIALVTLAAAFVLQSRPRLFNAPHTRPYPPTQEGVRQALREVRDWELEVNIVDLGLVRDIAVSADKKAEIKIIFTSAFCPYAIPMTAEIKKVVSSIEGIDSVAVTVDRSVSWTPEMMDKSARDKLKDLMR